jgi:hypothetical protein
VSPRARLALALVLGGLLTGCLQVGGDPAYLPVSLQPPYSTLPEAPPGLPIDPGMPVKLDPRQQEAVVAAVAKWMKDPGSAWFGALSGVKLRQGRIAVCGTVDGRNSAGIHPGMARFAGVMMGTPQAPEFVVVGIAQDGKARAEIDSICQRSGIF